MVIFMDWAIPDNKGRLQLRNTFDNTFPPTHNSNEVGCVFPSPTILVLKDLPPKTN